MHMDCQRSERNTHTHTYTVKYRERDNEKEHTQIQREEETTRVKHIQTVKLLQHRPACDYLLSTLFNNNSV